MIKYELALLETGSITVKEFVKSYFEKKSVHTNSSSIRIAYCDKCKTMDCEGCFIHDCLEAIYKINPFA